MLSCFKLPSPLCPGRKVHQSPKESAFKVDVDVHTCVHGYLAMDKKQPASLIIFKVQLIGTHGGIFERFFMEVTFNNVFSADSSARPEIISTAPFATATAQNSHFQKFKHEEIHEVTEMQEATGGATGALPGLMAGAKVGRKARKQSKRVTEGKYQFYDKCSSSTTTDRLNSQPIGVWWNIEKSSDPTLKDDASLQPTYLFAVLLTRPNHTAPFEAAIHLEVAARQNKKKAKGSQVFSKSESAVRPKSIHRLMSRRFRPVGDAVANLRPVIFDPVKLKREGLADGIKKKRLGVYMMTEKLAKLTEVKTN